MKKKKNRYVLVERERASPGVSICRKILGARTTGESSRGLDVFLSPRICMSGRFVVEGRG